MPDPTPSEEDIDRASVFCRENAIDYGDSVIEDPLALEFARIRAEEREACAKLCDALAAKEFSDCSDSSSEREIGMEQCAKSLREESSVNGN